MNIKYEVFSYLCVFLLNNIVYVSLKMPFLNHLIVFLQKQVEDSTENIDILNKYTISIFRECGIFKY